MRILERSVKQQPRLIQHAKEDVGGTMSLPNTRVDDAGWSVCSEIARKTRENRPGPSRPRFRVVSRGIALKRGKSDESRACYSSCQSTGDYASRFATSLREGESLQISKPDDGSGIVFTLHLDRGKAGGLAVSWAYSYSEVEKQDDSVFFREAASMLKDYREFEDVWKEPRLKVIDLIRSQMPDTVNGFLPNGIRCRRLRVAVLGQQSDVESMRQLSRNGADKCIDWFLLSSPEEAESYQGYVVVFEGFWYQDTSPAVWLALTRGLCSLDFYYIDECEAPPAWFRARIAREFSGRPSLLHGTW